MKVLVATDGSEFSNAAVTKCCSLFGESENTEIRIISVVVLPVPALEPFAFSAQYLGELQTIAEARAQHAVDAAKVIVAEQCPSLANHLTSTIVEGTPKKCIVEEAKAWGADLIIVGSHGAGFWESALLGSVSNSVVHHASCSVLVVRPPKQLRS